MMGRSNSQGAGSAYNGGPGGGFAPKGEASISDILPSRHWELVEGRLPR